METKRSGSYHPLRFKEGKVDNPTQAMINLRDLGVLDYKEAHGLILSLGLSPLIHDNMDALLKGNPCTLCIRLEMEIEGIRLKAEANTHNSAAIEIFEEFDHPHISRSTISYIRALMHEIFDVYIRETRPTLK